MKKCCIRWAAAFTAAAMLCLSAVIPTGAEEAAVGTADRVDENFESGNTLGGFVASLGGGIAVKTEESGNHYLLVSPSVDGVNTFVSHPLTMGDNVNLSIRFRYMQMGKKKDGDCLFSLKAEGKDVVRLDTEGGGFSMPTAGSTNRTAALASYSANTWYDFDIKVDFVHQTATVKIDGAVCVEEVALLQSVKSADSLYMSTKYSPGFGMDDISVSALQTVSRLELRGESVPKVSDEGVTECTYQALVWDTYDVSVKNAVRFTLLPADDGAVLRKDGDQAIIQWKSAAVGQVYTLTAEAGGITQSIEITPQMYVPQISQIVIRGDVKISSKTQKLYRYFYQAEVYDQNGQVMPDEVCSFTLAPCDTEIPSTISVDSETGWLTVTGEVPKDKHVYLVARSRTDASKTAQKKLTLLDAETYADDVSRFETLLSYVDRVREIGRDPYNGSPLIAQVYDRYAKAPGEWRSGTDQGHAVTSNLAFQGGWFRTLDGLYTLTGDQQYKDEIIDTYQYYIDHYLDDETGIPVMGGHAAVDLKKGRKYYIYGGKYLELKDAGVYMKPFFEIDPEGASQMVKNMFCSTVSKWKFLRFNRHGKYGTTPNYQNEGYGWDDYKTWSTKILDDEFGEGNPVVVQEIGFRSGMEDFLTAFGDMSKYGATEEDRESAATWGYNILSTYYRLENPDTFVGGYQNTSIGIDRYEDQMTKYPDWYLPNVYKSSNPAYMVDRFYVQFWEDLVDQGFLKEEDKWYAQECYVGNGSLYTAIPIHEMNFAESLGTDTEWGKYIIERTVKKMGKYVDLAYDAEDNTWASQLLWDGTSLDGFVSKRAGYNGGTDAYMQRYTRTTVGTLEPLSYALAYLKAEGNDALKPYRDSIYYFLRNTLIAKEVGDIGENYPGDRIDLNMNCDNSDGYMCLTMLYLYQATGMTEFLDMARKIADNFIQAKMVDGLFHINTSDVYLPLGSCKADRFEYSLLLLEAAVRGEMEAMPEYIPYDGYFEDRSYDELERGYRYTSTSDIKDTTYWFGYSFPGVYATEISVPENEIHLAVGEKKFLEITVSPSDASYSLCYDSTDPSCVAIDYDKNGLRGIKPGKTEITISNADKTAKTVLTVVVE